MAICPFGRRPPCIISFTRWSCWCWPRASVVARLPFTLFSIGIVIFSGSLYLLAVTNVKWLGAITPIGGLCLLAGWLALAFGRPSAAS